MTKSTISSGTVVRGRIVAQNDLEVAGFVEGSIQAEASVSLAAGSLIKSDVAARELHVAGAVNGDLTAKELLVLEEEARVVGRVSAPTVGIRPGAKVRGHVETSAEPSAAPPRVATTTRSAPKAAAKKPVTTDQTRANPGRIKREAGTKAAGARRQAKRDAR